MLKGSEITVQINDENYYNGEQQTYKINVESFENNEDYVVNV